MKLLFVQGGSRIKINSNGDKYVDGNFNNGVLNDYNKLSDECVFLLRQDSKKYEDSLLEKNFNKLDSQLNIKLVPDIYINSFSRFNILKTRKLSKIIENEVKNADKVIIRSIGNFYTNSVYKYCKKYNKSFLVEVTGLAFEGAWYHSLKGKFVSIFRELKLKIAVKNAPYVVYVTNEALQKRYPTNGKNIGCSDVRLFEINPKLMIERQKKYKSLSKTKKIKFGTVAFLDVKWKGQFDVIKAISILKKKYNLDFDYYLVGSGTGSFLKKIINKYKLNDNVHIIGPLTHDEVFKFIDDLDFYIQPSYREGLCRAVVEAMSRSCPVIVSNAGGNYELANKKFVFKKGNIKQIVKILSSLTIDDLILESKRSYEKSLEYNYELLETKRNEFYKNFVNNK